MPSIGYILQKSIFRHLQIMFILLCSSQSWVWNADLSCHLLFQDILYGTPHRTNFLGLPQGPQLIRKQLHDRTFTQPMKMLWKVFHRGSDHSAHLATFTLTDYTTSTKISHKLSLHDPSTHS